MNLLITGHTGFIGRALAASCQEKFGKANVNFVGRRCLPGQEDNFTQKRLSSDENYYDCLQNIDLLIHSASLKNYDSQNTLANFRYINVASTLNLAYQAALAGVKRFIFISSINVNGETTSGRNPFTEDDIPNPVGFYALSKWEAEQGLWKVQGETGMELVIIRPPLVYGPKVQGNFGSLMSLVQKGVPMPLGSIQNKISFVALDNLIDLIITCIDHPNAANQVFLAADGQSISTTELLRGLAKAAGVSPRLFPVPASILMFTLGLLGKKAVAEKVLCSREVDICKASDLICWKPTLSLEEGLSRCFVENDMRY